MDFRVAVFAGQNPESAGWFKVYEWTTFNDVATFAYTVNNSATAPAFTRILYQLLFDVYSVWCEVDDFTSNTVNRTGVPLTWTYNSSVTNGKVYYSANSSGFPTANASTISNRTFATGKLNFWPSDYSGSPDVIFNDNDSGSSAGNGYGSMQVFDTTVSPAVCIFAWNQWINNTAGDFGFGNRSTTDTDWTFASNGASIPPKLGRVFVK
jgi:hypothetical protein